MINLWISKTRRVLLTRTSPWPPQTSSAGTVPVEDVKGSQVTSTVRPEGPLGPGRGGSREFKTLGGSGGAKPPESLSRKKRLQSL